MSLMCITECCFVFFLIINIFELKKTANDVGLIIFFIILYPILVLVMVAILAAFPFFWIIKQLIELILKTRCGSDFHGLVEGLNVINVCDQYSGITQLLLIFEYDSSGTLDDWYGLVKNAVATFIATDASKFPKLFSTFENYLGYFYMKKISLNADDCVKKLRVIEDKKEGIEKSELIDLISECYYADFPLQGKALWDVYVGTQPVLWYPNTTNKSKKIFPVVLRICPGLINNAPLSTIWKSFCSDETESQINHNKPKCELKSCLSDAWKVLHLLMIFPSALFSNLILKGHDKNVLHGKLPLKKEVLGITTDVDGSISTKVKKIKNNLLSTTVSEILLTAYTASIDEYIKKKSTTQIKDITVLIPFPRNIELLEIRDNYYMLLKLPIAIQDQSGYNENTPLMSRLHMIKQLLKVTKNSLETQVFIFVTKYFCAVLPQSIVTILLAQFHATTGVSFSAPTTKMSFCDGKVVNVDCCLWLAHTNGLYSQFSVMSYDDRFQLGFNSDEIYFEKPQNAQSFVDGVCKHIDLLEKEVAYMYD